MRRPVQATSGVAAAVLALLALTAVAQPAALSQSSGGLWEVSGAGGPPQRICVADPALLAQYEHRKASCTRTVIRDQQALAEIHYTCADGSFGQSTIGLVTPRSLRIETQGISDNAPFHYTLQARRVGNC